MLIAYFDASTTQKKKRFVTVCGCLAPITRWRTFDSKWRTILRKEGLPFFHMTDFENYQGEYKNWTEKRHKHVMKKIARAIVGRVSFAFGRGVAHEDFEWAQQQNGQLGGFSPFTYCASQCLHAVAQWADQHQHYERIMYVFEAGDGYDGELLKYKRDVESSERRIERFRWGGLKILPKTMSDSLVPLTPLQAADVWAFEARKEWENYHSVGYRERPIRRSARALLGKGVEIDFGYSTRDSLATLAAYFETGT